MHKLAISFPLKDENNEKKRNQSIYKSIDYPRCNFSLIRDINLLNRPAFSEG